MTDYKYTHLQVSSTIKMLVRDDLFAPYNNWHIPEVQARHLLWDKNRRECYVFIDEIIIKLQFIRPCFMFLF